MTSAPRNSRLDARPSQLIDRSATVEFRFGRRRVLAHPGDTIASALYAAGVRVFSRSFKYHRSRGLLCVSGHCPNCLMTVDGVPNVRACVEPVRDGTVVRHQNAWPSLRRDVFSVLDRFDRLMPVGFYYKVFHRPRFLWRLAGPIIRRMAGLGSVDVDAVSDSHYDHESRHTDVAVVGGGAAGMSAALAAAGAGASVVLIDDQATLGGHLRGDATTYEGLSGLVASSGDEIATGLGARVDASEGIDVLLRATAFGLYEGNLLGVYQGDRMVELRACQIVVATGSYEVPLTFDRNDLPGVMLSTGAQRLMRLYGIRPGSTVLVATSTDQGYYAALDLLDGGARVVALTDSRPDSTRESDVAVRLRARGVPVLPSHALVRAEGKSTVTGVVVSRLAEGRPTTEERQVDCDLIAMSGGFQPASSLLQQAGAELRHDPSLGETVAAGLPPSVHAAGDVTGIHDLRASVLQGRLAGLGAAARLSESLGSYRLELSALRREVEEAEGPHRSGDGAGFVPSTAGRGAKEFVCFCEDVTAKDIALAVDEGFDDVQTLKRYSTVTMGPCQGKMCHGPFVRLAAELTGRSLDDMGATTARPPVQPVPLGALAGPSHLPIKRTSIDRKHRDLGAPMVDVGPWQRPYSYGSPQDEALAVRHRVGIIDVSTLGKLDVRGPDAAALLDKVYTHRFSDLRLGRIRYAIMCKDDGSILDDGTVTRLAEEHYFVTTTTGNLELIEQWFKWWMAGTGMCAHVTDVTSAFAAINVAGPRARDTLVKLTEVDLSPGAFRYMRSAQGAVAGVPTIFLRIGFVGETGWELHFPAEYGEHMWDALMEAGQEFGVSPFGVEAQRILRLEKGHIIVNQDTDAVSNPLESDMGWAVRFDKDDFIGRSGLLAVQDRGLRNRLVGFVSRDGVVPEDGDPVVAGFAPVGRVTSARMSPTLGKGFGLAWVPVEMAEEGKLIHIRVNGRVLPADVTLRPVYDPDGKRLRE